MKVLLAPDSFKGCLSSKEVCEALEKGIKEFSKDIDVMQFPSSDGGEGFCDCMRNIFGGEIVRLAVSYPLGNRGASSFVYNRDTKTAYIELASASGLMLVREEERDIMNSSTYGTGELMREAVRIGAKTLVVGLGGSATNDCGIGILSALGMRFYDANGNELPPIAKSLDKVCKADKNQLLDLSNIKIVAACDVKNPLCGINGAAEVFSRQKGASEEEVKLLDAALLSFAQVMGIDPSLQGAGAAGGVGAAILSVLGGKYVSGASLLLDSSIFATALKGTDVLITGEGNTDAQTAYGKLVSVVLEAAHKYKIYSYVVSGGLSQGYEALRSLGVREFYSLVDDNHPIEYCLKNAKEMISEKAYTIFESMKKVSS